MEISTKPANKTSAIWKQHKSESDLEFKYFSAYHLFGDIRTVGMVAQEFGISSRHLYKISKKHDWKKRVQASDLYHFQLEMRKLEGELKGLKKVRIVTAKNLYRSIQFKMKNFSEYIDCYIPDKAKNLTMTADATSDEHVSRLWKVLKMVNLYEQITTRFELFFEKEIAKSLSDSSAKSLDEDLQKLEEDVDNFDYNIETFSLNSESKSEQISEEFEHNSDILTRICPT